MWTTPKSAGRCCTVTLWGGLGKADLISEPDQGFLLWAQAPHTLCEKRGVKAQGHTGMSFHPKEGVSI